ELVPHRLPALAAVVGALDDLSEPAAGLRRVEPIRLHRRPLPGVTLPAAERRAGDVPLLARAVGCQDERSLARANQNAYTAHRCLLLLARAAFPQRPDLDGDGAGQRNPRRDGERFVQVVDVD